MTNLKDKICCKILKSINAKEDFFTLHVILLFSVYVLVIKHFAYSFRTIIYNSRFYNKNNFRNTVCNSRSLITNLAF